MRQYLNLLEDILRNGATKKDRTGVGTISVFGRSLRFDLAEGFPLVTTKQVYLKAIIYELLWFIAGETNIRPLVINGVNIWNEWPFQKYLQETGQANKYPKYQTAWKAKLQEFVESIRSDEEFAAQWGDLGPVYGKQWRDFSGVDQLAKVIVDIKTQPWDRGLIVNSWNAPDLPKMSLRPCHLLYQFDVTDNLLSCCVYIRSWDVFLGGPFNIASYALLTMMVAQVCDLEVGELIIDSGDTHIYLNLVDQVKQQINREPYPLPTMDINSSVRDIEKFAYSDFRLAGYQHHPAIKGVIAV